SIDVASETIQPSQTVRRFGPFGMALTQPSEELFRKPRALGHAQGVGRLVGVAGITGGVPTGAAPPQCRGTMQATFARRARHVASVTQRQGLFSPCTQGLSGAHVVAITREKCTQLRSHGGIVSRNEPITGPKRA